MAEACIEKGYKTAAVVTDIVESYVAHGKMFAQKFEALGGKVLVSETVDVKTTTDFHSVMTKIKAKNPDVIFIAVVEEPLALAVTHALDVGYKGKFIFTSDWGQRRKRSSVSARSKAHWYKPKDLSITRNILQRTKRVTSPRFVNNTWKPTKRIFRCRPVPVTMRPTCSRGPWR